ncbi:TIGR03084 family metal-binding protein [Pseudonocardia petroleophila]|uniref:Maleylpyruvate isomerase family mycothiol-dependent enzyme n=1 Tax=Pseudonocardia petroleophila TaxID=37331 RepID=A0A7G7ML54_9PSEU|nr:maleylpyruvate isomerase family mycothiol-dependent enzyme [Pseudonocardia petroleophila]QNG53515.1 maleylpyruvate isomerase family mycothiol-dependent enzyme [Pseudonocardia petroleophila]
MEAITQALREQHDELDAILAGLDGAGWAEPVPDCPGWSVTDVVLHLAQTDELVVSSLDAGFPAAAEKMLPGAIGETVDHTVDRLVEHERGASGPEVHARWRAASSAVRDVFAASDARRPMPWVVRDLPARTMATTRLSECWIHTHDVAAAAGVALVPGDRLRHIARLAVRTVPYAFARAGLAAPAGPVAAHLTAPDGGTWRIGDDGAATVVTGPAVEFCLIAARRLDPAASAVTATGPDADDVLRLVRTYA